MNERPYQHFALLSLADASIRDVEAAIRTAQALAFRPVQAFRHLCTTYLRVGLSPNAEDRALQKRTAKALAATLGSPQIQFHGEDGAQTVEEV